MHLDRLSPLDSSFLHIEDDVSHMHIGSLCVLEGPPPTYEDLLAVVSGKLESVARFRQVVKRVPLDLGRPVWAPDQHFVLEYHVRHTALPSPGAKRELERLVSRVMAQQLDRAKPLWELWMIEGLDGGRWAILAKVHHSMVDGVSGAALLTLILDLTPEVEVPEPKPWRPAPPPSPAALATEAAIDMARSPFEQLRAVRAATRVPRHATRQIGEILGAAWSSSGLVHQTPLSSLNGSIGPHRRWTGFTVHVAEVKEIRHSLGGSFNDVLIAACTRGFRDLLQHRGESVDRVVRSLVPVSVRSRDSTGKAVADGSFDNKVSAMFADLPVSHSDPVERLEAVAAQMDDLKESKQALAGEALTSLGAYAPPVLLSLAGRLGTRVPQRRINTITTNVPGPQFPLYSMGRLMVRLYPFVPLGLNVRISIAMFSYNGEVSFGITGDYDTTPDLHVLAEGIQAGIEELLEAARARGRPASTKRRAPANKPARRMERPPGGRGRKSPARSS